MAYEYPELIYSEWNLEGNFEQWLERVMNK